jgi:hypothetical protein
MNGCNCFVILYDNINDLDFVVWNIVQQNDCMMNWEEVGMGHSLCLPCQIK